LIENVLTDEALLCKRAKKSDDCACIDGNGTTGRGEPKQLQTDKSQEDFDRQVF